MSSFSVGPLGVSVTPDGGVFLIAARYTRSLGSGPLVIEVGGTDNVVLSPFGSGSVMSELHAAAGVAVSRGPILLTAAAGPSVGRTLRSSSRDPAYEDGRARTVPGLFVGARAVVVIVPAIGIGVETFAHANAELPASGVGVTMAFGRLPGALAPNPPPRPRPARLDGARLGER